MPSLNLLLPILAVTFGFVFLARCTAGEVTAVAVVWAALYALGVLV